jgi:hypothetical protein
VSLSNRHAVSLVFVVPALSAPGCVDNSEAKGDFSILLCGSNTGTSGEPLPTDAFLSEQSGYQPPPAVEALVDGMISRGSSPDLDLLRPNTVFLEESQ